MKLAALLFRPIHFLLYALGGLMPRDEHRWVFGAWGGTRFGDNPAALFLHCHRRSGQPDSVKVAWITSDPTIKESLEAHDLPVYLRWSPAGIWWSLRAGVYVYSALPKDINYWLSRGARHVHLRHGIGIKRIARAMDVPEHRLYKLYYGTWWQRLLYSAAIPWNNTIPDLVFSTSDEHADQAPDYFGVTRDKVKVTGAPRLDRLAGADEPSMGGGTVFDFAELRTRHEKIFLFMPTGREKRDSSSFSWADLDRAARNAGVGVAAKLHPDDAPKAMSANELDQQLENVRFIDPRLDPVTLFHHVDGLITDFSSVAFDFLLLEKPIVYFVPNLTSYLSARSLIDDLDNLVAGPICTTIDELSLELKDSESSFVDYHDRRATLKRRFHQYPAGGASDRVRGEILTAIDNGWA